MNKALANVIGNWLMSLVNGWLLMLAVGIAHAEWVPALPTIGYWWAVLLAMLLRGAFMPFKGSTK
jgi:Na+-driven multidrug efflux pump